MQQYQLNNDNNYLNSGKQCLINSLRDIASLDSFNRKHRFNRFFRKNHDFLQPCYSVDEVTDSDGLLAM